MATATLESYNQTPRKVRLVADLVRGKKVAEALAALEYLPKRAAEPVKKLIESAVANAKQQGEQEDLVVRSIVVESAGMLVRYMPRAFGRAAPVRKRKSRVKIEVGAI
jgi:large subunit ribosomal protein L22